MRLRFVLMTISVLSLCLSFNLSTNGILATDEVLMVEYEKINPGDDYKYVIKRLKEKIALFFVFKPESKVSYYKKLLSVRLAELKLVAENKDIANIQTTSQRYEATAGQLTEYIKKKSLSKYDQEVIDLFSSHIPVIQEVQKNYEFNVAEWRFLENDINSLKQYTGMLK